MTDTQHDFAPNPSPVAVTTSRPATAPDDLEVLLTQSAAGAAPALLKSLAVPRILSGADSDVVRLVLTQPEFGEAEPLLLAAAALTRSWIDIAESALAKGKSELAQTPDPPVTYLLSAAMITMAISRLRADAAGGLAQTSIARDLMIKLTAAERASASQLPLMIDYYAASFELSSGNLSGARWTLERAAGRFRQWLDDDADHAERRVRADCAGLLSWLDAVSGELRRATRYAGCLLTDRKADTGESGVKFAQLATVWIHLEHGEFEEAGQRLDHVLSTPSDNGDPLLTAAEQLTQARLAILTGEPDTALRLLHKPGAMNLETSSQWFADQFQIATADATQVVCAPPFCDD